MTKIKTLMRTAALGLAAATALTAVGEFKGGYFGTNYTAPFAHAYRQLKRNGVDPREAIDRDIYHLSRLGLTGYRLHLWDVELADSAGNLVEGNEHLDLLDYMLAKLKERGIPVVLTAQTNFGNGYPEKNTDPFGSFSYDYPKCRVHDEATAQEIQERYLRQLVSHKNPYTGLTYAADPSLLAIEVNNEPCHTTTNDSITAYINRMKRAMRKAGWKKPVFYNVSHNMGNTQGFYDADIDGATFQWYPLGLVAGHTRRGNFLPWVDSYDIPFSKTVKGADKVPGIVYEFDPADNLYSYLLPAAARSFRKAGMQWATQFAYDPIDMAAANTEYQTHYLNLAYTPAKALGLMVAAEVMGRVPSGKDYGKYPTDTIFGPFLVSAHRDLAMLNDGKAYIHTNPTEVAPVDVSTLERVAGLGSSPIVDYQGSGAYFLDRLQPGVWRVEVMPDAVTVADPFEKPSPGKRVVEILFNERPMTVALPELGKEFAVRRLDNGATAQAHDGRFEVEPGVYLIGRDAAALESVKADDTYGDGHRRVGEYVAPKPVKAAPAAVVDIPAMRPEGATTPVRATVIGPSRPDSVLVYPEGVSFWTEHNTFYPMQLSNGIMEYAVDLPADVKAWNIVAFYPEIGAVTFPEGRPGTPLDWDAPDNPERYTVATFTQGEPLALIEAGESAADVELAMIPNDWQHVGLRHERNHRDATDLLSLDLKPTDVAERVMLSRYVAPLTEARPDLASGNRHLRLNLDATTQGVDSVTVALVNDDGFTYAATVPVRGGVVDVAVESLSLVPTTLNPEPYPVFLSREFVPDPSTATPLQLDRVQTAIIEVAPAKGKAAKLAVKSLTLE